MKIIRNVLIALLVALLAGGVGFYGYIKSSDDTNTIKTVELGTDSVLPDIYAYMDGQKVNRMTGYTENNAFGAGRGDLTILPEDRKLQILITETNVDISGIWYEIRDLSGENFIERTTVENWSKTADGVTAFLPIENLVEQDAQYRLTICISSVDYPAVYYYCRITDNSKIGEYLNGMIELAQDFSGKIYRYNDARDLTTYLESNSTADNSSLGHITLENSYNQLTYNNTKPERRGEPDLHIKEALGNMAVVYLDSLAVKNNEHGTEEFFNITEGFTMRQGPERIYMMSYDRHMNQIFTGNPGSFSSKNAKLGVSDTDSLQCMYDEEKNFTAWTSNGSLWLLDSKANTAYELYSSRNRSGDFDYAKSRIHILRMSETGDMDFTVSGYMNNGKHEGMTGSALYHFNLKDETVSEQLFVDGYASAEEIISEENSFSYINETNTFYSCMGGSLYQITEDGEASLIVKEPIRMSSSQKHDIAAWQKNDKSISVMNLETGETHDYRAANGQLLKLIGFVGTDMVYGEIDQNITPYKIGSRDILPMTRIVIENAEGQVEARYEKPDMVLLNADIDKSRVHISRAFVTGNTYEAATEDTLICNDELNEDTLAGISSSIDNSWGRLYYAAFGHESKKTPKVSRTDKQYLETQDVSVEKPDDMNLFFSYSDGRFQGSYTEFTSALRAAYDGMGIVTDPYDHVIWARADRKDMITIRDIPGLTPRIKEYISEFDHGSNVASDGTLLLDCMGLNMSQVLYFVSKGLPVVAYKPDGSYGFIYGYDNFNISICWFPGTEYEYSEKMGLQDSAAYFENHCGNRFVAFLAQ